MKRIITLALAVLMVASMATVAFAAESTTTLTAKVPAATYTLNIPANQEIPFGTTKASIGNITVTGAAGFATGKNLNVTITYDAFSAEGISTQIPYTLNLFAEAKTSSSNPDAELALPTGTTITFAGKANGSTVEAVVLDCTTANGTILEKVSATDICFKAKSEDWGKALAGEYTSTITFTAEVVVEE